MPNKTYRDMRLKIDNAVPALADITAYINQVDMAAALEVIEDNHFSDTTHNILTGAAGPVTFPFNGVVNTTTDTIFGPRIGNQTSITKTLELRSYATNTTGNVGRFYNCEVVITNVRYSGSRGALQTFSIECVADGTINRTTAALV